MAIRVHYEDVMVEKAMIMASFNENARRPVDVVFERVARSRVEKTEIARRRALWQGNVEVVQTPKAPINFATQFEMACRQRGQNAKKLAATNLEEALMYCIILNLPSDQIK